MLLLLACATPNGSSDASGLTGPTTGDTAEGFECAPGFVELDAACVYDDAAVAELVLTYTKVGFTRVNPEPFEQQTEPWWPRNVWVGDHTVGALEAYTAIDPEDRGTVEFPVGTIFMHDADGPPFVGVMVKLPEGSDEEYGDWAFRHFMNDGTAIEEEACGGPPCMECHSLLEDTDMVWGVPWDALD